MLGDLTPCSAELQERGTGLGRETLIPPLLPGKACSAVCISGRTAQRLHRLMYGPGKNEYFSLKELRVFELVQLSASGSDVRKADSAICKIVK